MRLPSKLLEKCVVYASHWIQIVEKKNFVEIERTVRVRVCNILISRVRVQKCWLRRALGDTQTVWPVCTSPKIKTSKCRLPKFGDITFDDRLFRRWNFRRSAPPQYKFSTDHISKKLKLSITLLNDMFLSFDIHHNVRYISKKTKTRLSGKKEERGLKRYWFVSSKDFDDLYFDNIHIDCLYFGDIAFGDFSIR
jgi:hypothetical protein